jgi:hypothetical protein
VTQDGWERAQTFDPIGRQVGVTARAMRVLLDGALATAGSTFADWTERAGLVARSPVPGDRRASLVSMTDAGRERFGVLHDVLRSTEIALTDGIDPPDLETTLRVLAQIADRARSLHAGSQASH